MSDWDPELYNRFRSYRAEPFRAILARLRLDPAEEIVDLGCGSGENTIALVQHAAQGTALGIDSSPAMIERANLARSALPSEVASRLEFRQGDIADPHPARQFSLVFSNAALHWIADHRRALAAWRGLLRAGGRLVVQMPANYHETAQVTLMRLAAQPQWRQMLSGVSVPSANVGTPEYYTRLLEELGFEDTDCYYQVFVHPMNGPGDVVEWSRATVLRPFVDALAGAQREEFVGQWRRELEQAYATSGPLTFNFRRIFIWARRREK